MPRSPGPAICSSAWKKTASWSWRATAGPRSNRCTVEPSPGELAGKQAWEAATTLYDQAFAGMSAKEIDQLTALLERVAENLKGPASTDSP